MNDQLRTVKGPQKWPRSALRSTAFSPQLKALLQR